MRAASSCLCETSSRKIRLGACFPATSLRLIFLTAMFVQHFGDGDGALLLGGAERGGDDGERGDAFFAADLRRFFLADAVGELFQLFAEHVAAAERDRLVL